MHEGGRAVCNSLARPLAEKKLELTHSQPRLNMRKNDPECKCLLI